MFQEEGGCEDSEVEYHCTVPKAIQQNCSRRESGEARLKVVSKSRHQGPSSGTKGPSSSSNRGARTLLAHPGIKESHKATGEVDSIHNQAILEPSVSLTNKLHLKHDFRSEQIIKVGTQIFR